MKRDCPSCGGRGIMKILKRDWDQVIPWSSRALWAPIIEIEETCRDCQGRGFIHVKQHHGRRMKRR